MVRVLHCQLRNGWRKFAGTKQCRTGKHDFFRPHLSVRGGGGAPHPSRFDDWFKAPDLSAQKKLAADIQVEAYTNDAPYVPTGQFVAPTAYRKNLEGIIIAPVVFLWNVEKK